MQIDEFLDLARRRRSIRGFKPEPVPDEYVLKILEVARWAMSGANAQPWEFIVVKNQETKTKMHEVYLHYYQMQVAVELTRLPEYQHPALARKEPAAILWRDAPVIIVVLGDMRTMQASTITLRLFEHHTFDQNMANAVHMMQLAAAALGLGAQWVSLDPPRSEALKPILGVPPEIKIFCLVPVGYPSHQPSGYRRDLSELVHYEKYDMSRLRSQNDIQEFIKYLRRRDKKSEIFPE